MTNINLYQFEPTLNIDYMEWDTDKLLTSSSVRDLINFPYLFSEDRMNSEE